MSDDPKADAIHRAIASALRMQAAIAAVNAVTDFPRDLGRMAAAMRELRDVVTENYDDVRAVARAFGHQVPEDAS